MPDWYSFPEQFVQGDQLQFRIVNQAPYQSSDGWNFTLVLRLENPQDNNVGAYTITATVDGSNGDFVMLADKTVTVSWIVGRYQWFVYALNGNDRETTAEGFVEVTPNLGGTTGDIRSHARRMLDIIEALLEGRASTDILSSQIDNTHFTRMGFRDITEAHSYYTSQVRLEEAKARVKQGRATGRLIYARFSRPF